MSDARTRRVSEVNSCPALADASGSCWNMNNPDWLAPYGCSDDRACNQSVAL